jgi:signal transduction histidine kinase
VTIKGFIGSIGRDLQDMKYERAQKDIVRVATAADKMYETLTGLLELAQIGRVVNRTEDVDLVQLAQEALATAHEQIQVRNVAVKIFPDLPIVHGDRIRLREIYENLIINATKYMGNQTEPIIEIGKRVTDNETTLFVKDNGMGIDPRYSSRIFNLFEKLDPNSDGTGIGLAIVKRIVENHGGKIWVESDGSGKGSTFCFTIPDMRK